MLLILVFAILALVPPSLQDHGPIENMTVVHVWKNLEYSFETPEEYQFAIENGILVEEGMKRPYDCDIHVKKNRGGGKETRVFISTPRIGPGVPYTLCVVSKKKGKLGPKLLPYPDFASHSEHSTPNCNRIISVFRIFVDACQRLWAIDNGRNFQASPTQICPPKILVFDLRTDKLLLQYEIPEGQYFPEKSAHNGIIVDVYDPPPHGRCRKGKAYITDARGPSLLVLDFEKLTSWVIWNDLFKPDPAYIPTTIAGETFQFPDGLYTSTPMRELDTIFLHAFASRSEIAAPLSLVNDQSLFADDPSAHPEIFTVIGTRPTQSPTQAKDPKGNIYFSILDPLAIMSWDPRTPYDESNFHTVVRNDETLQFVAGLKVRQNSDGSSILLALSIRLQKLNTGTISPEEDNFRLMVCKTSTLQTGWGKCGHL